MTEKLLVIFLRYLIKNMSPQLRDWLVEMVQEFEKRAAATENKIDDMLVEILKVILNM